MQGGGGYEKKLQIPIKFKMKNEINTTLAKLIQLQDLKRFGNTAKNKKRNFEIVGWIFLIFGRLMMLAGITGNPSAVRYYYAVFV